MISFLFGNTEKTASYELMRGLKCATNDLTPIAKSEDFI